LSTGVTAQDKDQHRIQSNKAVIKIKINHLIQSTKVLAVGVVVPSRLVVGVVMEVKGKVVSGSILNDPDEQDPNASDPTQPDPFRKGQTQPDPKHQLNKTRLTGSRFFELISLNIYIEIKSEQQQQKCYCYFILICRDLKYRNYSIFKSFNSIETGFKYSILTKVNFITKHI